MSRNNSKNSLKVILKDYAQEIRFLNTEEQILEYAAFIKDPDDVCRVYNIPFFSFSGDYSKDHDEWHGRVHISKLEYDVSYDTPYSGEYSMFFFFRSETIIVIITLAMPSLKTVKVSGLHVSIGIMGANYNNVMEEASAIIRGWSDKALREIMKKEIADANTSSAMLDDNYAEDEAKFDYNGEEDECYE